MSLRIDNIPYYNIYPANIGFRSGGNTVAAVNVPTVPINAPYTAPDVVEISADKKIKKEGLSKGQKWAIGIGSAIATLAATAILLAKHQIGKLTKLYNEKMQLVNLGDKIDFKEAKTVEEGIKFAKEVLKVGDVDKNFTLDAINYANRGLTEVANANKGRLFIPKKLCYEEMEGNAVAYVIRTIDSPRFGELAINKKYFDKEFLKKQINKYLFDEKGIQTYKKLDKDRITTTIFAGIPIVPSKESFKLINQFYKNPDSMNVNDMRTLYYSFNSQWSELIGKFERFPLDTIKKHKNLFEKELNQKINIEELAQKTTKEQEEFLITMTKALGEKGSPIQFNLKLVPTEHTIYHEMGHLQDFAKNLKELDIKHWKMPSFKDAWNEVKNGKKHQNTAEIEFVDNRWSGLTYDGFQELFEKNPKKFKKQYPDLYEFLTNQETQQTAGKISSYAQTSIGEFIADTYAKMIRGEKLPDDVMALYKKYNGPDIPFA